MSQSRATADHDEIKKWVEERGGYPASVAGTGGKDQPGVLRIDFPGGSDDKKLERIEWEDFFNKFDRNGLAFLFQEETSEGKKSRFFKFVKRDEKS